jgi:hypothetical protein
MGRNLPKGNGDFEGLGKGKNLMGNPRLRGETRAMGSGNQHSVSLLASLEEMNSCNVG